MVSFVVFFAVGQFLFSLCCQSAALQPPLVASEADPGSGFSDYLYISVSIHLSAWCPSLSYADECGDACRGTPDKSVCVAMHVQYETHTDVQQRACHNYVASMAKTVGWMWGYTHAFQSGKRRWSQSIYVSFHLILLFQWWQSNSATVPFPFIVSVFVSGEPPPPSVESEGTGQYRWRWGGEGKRNRKYEGRLWISQREMMA